MIELKDIVKTYPDGTKAVDHLSLVAPAGKITVLVGPSGCGKTTTLRMINRLVEPTSGTILLGGEDSTSIDPIHMRRKIGYVIQSGGLFPHLTILDNICAVPFLDHENLTRARKTEIRERALELLQVVGLDAGYATRYPWQLSGGQQQRVGVARALAADPPYMLMDEPFSAVDPLQREQLQAEFLRIQSRFAKTIVMVTHDVDEAMLLGDRIALFKKGGILAQVGTPQELLAHPADQFVADFLGKSRGYRALSFARVGASRMERTPTVRIGESARVPDNDWLVVLDGTDTPIGWCRATQSESVVTDSAIHFAAPVPLHAATYRELLDASLASPSGSVIGVDADRRYAGTLHAEAVMRGAIGALNTEQAS